MTSRNKSKVLTFRGTSESSVFMKTVPVCENRYASTGKINREADLKCKSDQGFKSRSISDVSTC
jgi:hypothetical protein